MQHRAYAAKFTQIVAYVLLKGTTIICLGGLHQYHYSLLQHKQKADMVMINMRCLLQPAISAYLQEIEISHIEL